METKFLARLDELVAQGRILARSHGSDDYWVRDVPKVQAWLASAAHAILQVAPVSSFYCAEIDRLTNHEELKRGITVVILEKMLGLLESMCSEANAGMLAKLEYQIFATAFDDFLDHAGSFHKSGKLKEAAVLVSAVLEDVLKRIAAKNGIDAEGMSLEPLLNKFGAAQIFTEVKVKRIKSYVGVRNAAQHANWDDLDLKDVGQAIQGVRELVDDYL